MNIGRGPKDAIAAAVEAGQLKAQDIVVTTGANPGELVLIERGGEQVVVTSRTQEDIEVMGVNLSDGVANGKVIPAGTDLEEFIKQLVQKSIAATYTQPSVKIANNGGQAATTVEAGSTVSVKLTSTFTKGDAGDITSHVITKDGTTVAESTESTVNHQEELTVADGNNVFKSTVSYNEGAIKNDNFGDASPSGHVTAGSKSSSNYIIVGARKAFYGAVASLPELTSENIRALEGSTLAPVANGTFNVTIAEGEQHVIVALPEGRTLSQVTYVDLGDKGMLSKFTSENVMVMSAAAADGMNYMVYTYSMASPAAAAMNFEFLMA